MTDDEMCDPPKYCLFDSVDGDGGTSFQPTSPTSETIQSAGRMQQTAGTPQLDHDASIVLHNNDQWPSSVWRIYSSIGLRERQSVHMFHKQYVGCRNDHVYSILHSIVVSLHIPVNAITI